MADTTTYLVGDQQVRVRAYPTLRAAHVRWLNPGEQIEGTARIEADGYVWWQHSEGWSAEKSSDGAETYLFEAQETTVDPAQSKKFKVDSQVRIRAGASLNAAHVRWLDPGSQVIVNADSRTEADGYVWWQHSAGWSAEKSLTEADEIYMIELQAPTVVTSSKPADSSINTAIKDAATENAQENTEQDNTSDTQNSTPTKPTTATKPAEEVKKTVYTASQQVRIRSAPSLNGEHEGWIMPGTVIEVFSDSQTIADGYVWWEHADGWSAERNTDNTTFFLTAGASGGLIDSAAGTGDSKAAKIGPYTNYRDDIDINSLPNLDTLFKKIPFELARAAFWQYYGNNRFSQKIWSQGKRWYSYCQSLHAGIDFGVGQNTGSVPVIAGIEGGTFSKHITNYYAPNGLFVNVGPYTIIYGHIDNPRSFNKGDAIGVDTVMGDITFGGWSSTNHLHLEVRYRGAYLVNPLLLMAPEVREAVMARFKPYTQYFYSDSTWDQWITPLDQPIIRLSDPVIGPNSR